jgi:A/G-specific adenine glycosylase
MRSSTSALTHSLLAWFRAERRILPWRETRTPYRVWVSETMLQQTQVATVVPYFERWMNNFPNLEALASAPQETVLKAWEGLGYYRRARLLHQGARVVVAEHDGVIPDTYTELLELPGIGPYTAAAIASLAFGERVLAVDGNVKRVASRLFCLPGVVQPRAVHAVLEPHLPEKEAGDFNEALMELGATVCTPRVPRCEACPIRDYCQAFQRNQVARFPEPVPRKKVPHHFRYALVAEKNGALWLRRRGESEMLGGLWGFVLSEAEPEGVKLEPVQHAYTHFKITATPVLVETPPLEGQWIARSDLGTLPLSRLDHKILTRISGTTGA